MNKYRIVSDFDGQESMDIIAASQEDAAVEALERLGYTIEDGEDADEENAGYEE